MASRSAMLASMSPLDRQAALKRADEEPEIDESDLVLSVEMRNLIAAARWSIDPRELDGFNPVMLAEMRAVDAYLRRREVELALGGGMLKA